MRSPQTNNASRPVPVTQTSFAGGMRDRDHPSLLDPNQYYYGKDIEIRDSGLAKMRSGRTTKTSNGGSSPQGGVWYKDNNGNEYIVTVNGGKTYYWTGSGMTLTQIGSTTFNNTTTNVSFCILNGKLFIAPGTGDNVYSWTGSGSLTDEGNTDNDPPLCTLLCQQAGRIISGGEAAPNQDYIRFSDIFDGQTWSRTLQSQRIPTDGSEAVTGISTYRKEEVLIFTPFSTSTMDIGGSIVSQFQRISLDAKVGCIAPRSIVVVGDDAFFMSSDRQIRTIKRTSQDLAFGVSLPITYLVPNLIKRINDSYASISAGVYFNNYYLISVPLDTSTINNGIIVFDTLHQFQTPSGGAPLCVGEWTNFKVNQFVRSYFNGVEALHYIDSENGSIVQMFDNSGSDDGSLIDCRIDCRGFDFNSPDSPKTAHDGEIQFIGSNGTLNLYYIKDDATLNSVGEYSIGDNSANLPVSLPFNLVIDSGINPLKFPMYRTGRSKYWRMRCDFNGNSMNIKQLILRSWVEDIITR